nr:MAG TPA: hypothetical protein [Caudoviricetes sp.]
MIKQTYSIALIIGLLQLMKLYNQSLALLQYMLRIKMVHISHLWLSLYQHLERKAIRVIKVTREILEKDLLDRHLKDHL